MHKLLMDMIVSSFFYIKKDNFIFSFQTSCIQIIYENKYTFTVETSQMYMRIGNKCNYTWSQRYILRVNCRKCYLLLIDRCLFKI